MDQGIQAIKEVNPICNPGITGGAAQPCAKPAGKRGRPKKLRPPTPTLTRELAVVLKHFFPDLPAWLNEVTDPRKSGHAVYSMKVLLLLGVLMFLSHSGSRNHFNDRVRAAIEMAKTMSRILGCQLDAVPHLDTLEKVLRSVDPATMETLHAKLIRRLIRMKALDGWRVDGRFMLAIDGTGMYTFHKRHCEYCIEVKHSSGVVTYQHKVAVAFIVSTDGYALPIACEFIENPEGEYDKQDCEIKAFHRLEPKIRQLYPQINFWLLLDALYADQNVMRKVLKNGWNAAITFMESDMPSLWAEAQSVRKLSHGQNTAIILPKQQGKLEIDWVNDLDYQGMKLSAIFQVEKDKNGNVVQSFAHLILKPIHKGNAIRVAMVARERWRCENEGFNVLKNGGFALKHVYSRNPTAAKGYFMLMLSAHVFQQLLTRGRLGTVFKDTFHTFLAYGQELLNALIRQSLPDDLQPPGQIRLSTA